RRRADQRAALPFEQLEAELVLEQLQLLADTRLRGVQHARGLGNVEIVLGNRHEISQLDEFHRAFAGLVAIEGVNCKGYEGEHLCKRPTPSRPGLGAYAASGR